MRTRDEDSRRGLVVRTREPLAPFSCFIVIGFVSPSGPMENVLRFLEGKTLLAAGPCTVLQRVIQADVLELHNQTTIRT
jgi:hypothetical protein